MADFNLMSGIVNAILGKITHNLLAVYTYHTL